MQQTVQNIRYGAEV